MEKEKKYTLIIWGLAILSTLLTVSLVLLIYRKPTAPKMIRQIKEPLKARIAIVIDDMGYSRNNLETIAQINYPVTFSILPSLAYSTSVAQELLGKGFEIILHLPMEPYEKINLENNTILASMDEAQIRQIVENDLNDMPYVKGISNHMGSKVTEDARVMGILFSELKKRQLYFLDSFVTGKSAGMPLAKAMHIRFTRRDVFLDNDADPRYIKQQLNQLLKKARQKGQAIGIGHDRKHTLEVLKEVMPELSRQGYKFVFVSELLR